MTRERAVRVAAGPVSLEGDLSLPESARGLVLFAHGSGSSRFSPRNRHVARLLNSAGLATLLVDLLTPEEEAFDERTAQLRFDIDLLAHRLIGATDWLTEHPDTRALRIGYFGASTGAGAALVAAARTMPTFMTARAEKTSGRFVSALRSVPTMKPGYQRGVVSTVIA